MGIDTLGGTLASRWMWSF